MFPSSVPIWTALPVLLLAAGSPLAANLPPKANAAPAPKANAAPARPFREILGLNVKYSQGEPVADLPLLDDLGVRWVRDNVGWAEMEPAPGRFVDFPPAFWERLRFYKAHNIGVLFGLWYDNPDAYPNTPENPHHSVDAEAYGRYAVEVARRLKASGVRFVLEIWNEPHNFVLGKLVGGSWNAKPPSPWVDRYVRMVGQAVGQVKAFDPRIPLLEDEDMWVSHYWFLEMGLPRALDGFAFHPYGSGLPEAAAVDQNTDWAKPFTLVDADRSLRSAVRRLRDRGREKLGHAPALWATEWGWKIGDPTAYGPATEEIVAEFVPRAYVTAAASGVEAVFWFSSYDSVDGAMGLRANGGRRRKAYGAFKTMSRELGPYALARHVIGSDHLTSGVQAFLFRGPAGSKHVLWDIDGVETVRVKSTAPTNGKRTPPVRIADVLGDPVPVRRAKDGRIELTLSPAPIYVTGLPDNLSLESPSAALAAKPVYLFK